MEKYQAKGTLLTCPYSGEPAILSSFGDDIDKSQCSHSHECTVEQRPLEQEIKCF